MFIKITLSILFLTLLNSVIGFGYSEETYVSYAVRYLTELYSQAVNNALIYVLPNSAEEYHAEHAEPQRKSSLFRLNEINRLF